MGNKSVRKPVIGFRDKNTATCVINDEMGVRVVEIPGRDFDKSPPLRMGEGNYPLDRIVAQFDEIGKRKGITFEALTLLKRAISGEAPETAPETPAERPGAVPRAANGKSSYPDSPRKPKTSIKAAPSVARGALISRIAVEFKLGAAKLRAALRAEGLRAPYDNEASVREAIKRAIERGSKELVNVSHPESSKVRVRSPGKKKRSVG